MSKTMTELLRQAAREALDSGQTLRGMARAVGVHHPALLRFIRGDQSMMLDAAERLASHLGIEARRKPKRKRRKVR